MILMLEDCGERLARFTAMLQSIDRDMPLIVWRNARTMIDEVGRHLPAARLLSLDHDLEPLEGEPDDVGDGYEVAKFLTGQSIVRPVIVHSSNGSRSDWMMGEFELAGWRYWRVAPIGDDWIETDWHLTVRRILKRKSGFSKLGLESNR